MRDELKLANTGDLERIATAGRVKEKSKRQF